MSLGLIIVLVVLGLFVSVLSSLTFFYQKGKGIEVAEAEAKESQTKALTSLTKDDYDFLIANGLEVDPEVHRHFYPDKGKQMAEWVEETFDPTFLTWIDHEPVGGIRRRNNKTEWNVK